MFMVMTELCLHCTNRRSGRSRATVGPLSFQETQREHFHVVGKPARISHDVEQPFTFP